MMSMAVASQPRRMASSGIAPPPENGSSTFGAARRKRHESSPETIQIRTGLAPPVQNPALSLLDDFLDGLTVLPSPS